MTKSGSAKAASVTPSMMAIPNVSISTTVTPSSASAWRARPSLPSRRLMMREPASALPTISARRPDSSRTESSIGRPSSSSDKGGRVSGTIRVADRVPSRTSAASSREISAIAMDDVTGGAAAIRTSAVVKAGGRSIARQITQVTTGEMTVSQSRAERLSRNRRPWIST